MKKSVNNSKSNRSLIIWMTKGSKSNIPQLITSDRNVKEEKNMIYVREFIILFIIYSLKLMTLYHQS